MVSLGGDHAITYPILRAYSRFYPDLTPVYLDAHPYDTLFPNRWPNFHPPVEALPQAYL